MERLYKYAEIENVTIVHADLSHLNRSGDYHRPTRTIRLQSGMSYRKERHSLGHELAHHYYGDEPSIFGYLSRRQEDRADEWAAHFLINEHDYRLAEEKYGSNRIWIAQELGVLKLTVEAYERTLCRIGDTIYVSPQLGSAKRHMRA